MRYFCVQDCFTNNQYFRGGRFYEDYDVQRGIVEGESEGELKYFIQIHPKLVEPQEPNGPKEGVAPTEKQRDEKTKWEVAYTRWMESKGFLDTAIDDASKELRELKELSKKGTVRGIGARMQTLEGLLRELRVA